jgi:hypothetical protein
LLESNGRQLMAEAIDGRGRVKKGIKRGDQGGGVKTLTSISMVEARRHGVAGDSEESQRHGRYQLAWGRGRS